MATIGAVHDLSGVGRCSLTAAISVLSAMGHHCCPLPTAVLSNQTGFDEYTYYDFSAHIPGYLRAWDHLGLRPDMLFTGFLGSVDQPRLLAEYLERHPKALAVVDPVLGDHGVLYPCYDGEFVTSMRTLVGWAQVITPNQTELLLLAGENPAGRGPLEDGEALELIRGLQAPRLRQAVVTGIVEGNQVCNLAADLQTGAVHRVRTPYTGVSYSGTGDIFASVVCGCIAGGQPFGQAVEQAARFVSGVAAAMPPNSDPRCGLHFERYLSRLIPPTATGSPPDRSDPT